MNHNYLNYPISSLKAQGIKKEDLIHFIGICGIGMSGIAIILKQLNYNVQGSDLIFDINLANDVSQNLINNKIPVFSAHDILNIGNASIIVVSSGIAPNNVELIEAKSKNIKIFTRAQMLSVLMQNHYNICIAGSHGKTSTTALVTHMISNCKITPTFVNGGIIINNNTNACIGSDNDFILTQPIFISETDESDGSFIHLPTTLGIITNIDNDHLDFYLTLNNLKKYFLKFINQIPDHGAIIINIDDENTCSLLNSIKTKIPVITYSINRGSLPITNLSMNFFINVNAHNITLTTEGSVFDVDIVRNTKLTKITNIKINSYGNHNIQNALAAISAGIFLNLDLEDIKIGLSKFKGVKRRFTHLGTIKGITFIDDYAHHPTEIKATLATAKLKISTDEKNKSSKIIAVFQPHRYSRFQELEKEFIDSLYEADIIIVMNIYSAGEKNITGIGIENFLSQITDRYQNKEIYRFTKSNLIAEIAKKGDIVLFLGAGDITTMAANFMTAFQHK